MQDLLRPAPEEKSAEATLTDCAPPPGQTWRACTAAAVRWVAHGLACSYVVGMLVWFVTWLAWRDGTWFLFLVNAWGLYLFAPLPLALAYAALARKPWLGGVALVLAAASLVVAASLLPVPRKQPGLSAGSGPEIRVMTFNVAAFNREPRRTRVAIREAQADLVLLQELTPDFASALSTHLSDAFPHQVLEPRRGVLGMGALSKYPLKALPGLPKLPNLPGALPQLLEVEAPSLSFYAVNFHLPVNGPQRPSAARRQMNARNTHARVLAQFARDCGKPIVLAGDVNATPLHQVHRAMTQELSDAWAVCGRGLGNTFPAGRQYGYRVPRWMLRLDYVFYSRHWHATSAELGPWYGGSDHRPVIAVLRLEASG